MNKKLKILIKNNIFSISILIFILGAFSTFLIFFFKNNTGEIGDTIAGILGTSISFIAAILVYTSFNAQIEANKQISKQLYDDRIYRLFEFHNKSLKDGIKELLLKFEEFEKYCNHLYNKEQLGYKLYDDYEQIVREIEDNIKDFKKLDAIYNTANDNVDGIQESFQALFTDIMHENLKPYLWYIKEYKPEILNKLPIIKIQPVYNYISYEQKLISVTFINTHEFRLTKLTVKGTNDIEHQFTINIIVENPYLLDLMEFINLQNIQPNDYYLSWEISYLNKTFTYIDNETYSINPNTQ